MSRPDGYAADTNSYVAPVVSPSDVAAHRHNEILALLRDIKELLADAQRARERFMGDHK